MSSCEFMVTLNAILCMTTPFQPVGQAGGGHPQGIGQEWLEVTFATLPILEGDTESSERMWNGCGINEVGS
jgi:hypothetical protein